VPGNKRLISTANASTVTFGTGTDANAGGNIAHDISSNGPIVYTTLADYLTAIGQ
jgi:hypothetical protein